MEIERIINTMFDGIIMKECHTVYRDVDKPYLPYPTTAKECIDYLRKKKSFNFWKLPDSELVKLSQYHQKHLCDESRDDFTIDKLREAKELAIREYLENIDKTRPITKVCNYEINIESKTFSGIGKCNLTVGHGDKHSYVF